MPNEALIYCRISIADSRTPKVEQQLKDLRALAAREGLTVAGVYTDDGISAAKAENRPDFDRLLGDLPAHPGAVILATEEARLARNNHEKGTLTAVCAAHGITWRTMRDGAVDPADAAGEFMAVIRGAVDTIESKRKGQRQRAANEHRRAQGLPTPGQRAFGWEKDQITPVPAEQALIRQGIDMILAGERRWAVIKAWNASGIKTGRGNAWTSTSVTSVLTRARNAALIEHKGQIVGPATWNAICTPEELQAVRAACAVGTTSGWRRPVGVASGVARCGKCESTMYVTGNRQGRSYRCGTLTKPGARGEGHASIKFEALEEKVRAAIGVHYAWLARVHAERPQEQSGLVQAHAELAKVREELEAHAAGLALGMKPATWAKIQNDLVAREEAVLARIATLASASAHDRLVGAVVAKLGEGLDPHADADQIAQVVGANFEGLEIADQRAVTAAALSITVHPGRATDRVKIVHRDAVGFTGKLTIEGLITLG